MTARHHAVILERGAGRSWRDSSGARLEQLDGWDLTIVTDRISGASVEGVRTIAIGDFTADRIHDAITAVSAGGPIDRLSTTSENYLTTIAGLRETLGIAGPGIEYTERLRDKWVMKQTARTAGLPTLDGALAPDALSWAAVRAEAPLVLKPRSGSGSQGVRVLASRDALAAAITELTEPSNFLVEPYLDADILHVDVVVHRGSSLIEVSRYLRPCHVSGGTVPLSSATVAPGLLRDAVDEAVALMITAWQIESDVLHIEFFADNEGVTLLEVAGRPGAAGVSEVFRATRGLDLHHAKTLADLGLDPFSAQQESIAPHGGWSVFYAPTDAPALVDDAGLDAHWTRSVLAPGATRIDGIAGLGVATYSFSGATPDEVLAMIQRYEREVVVTSAEPGQ